MIAAVGGGLCQIVERRSTRPRWDAGFEIVERHAHTASSRLARRARARRHRLLDYLDLRFQVRRDFPDHAMLTARRLDLTIRAPLDGKRGRHPKPCPPAARTIA